MPIVLMALMSLDIGGAETHVVELSKELARRGWNVIVASNGGAYTEELERCGIKHYSVPLHRKNPKCMLTSYRLLKKIITEEKPDIVHAHARIPGFILGKLHRKMHFPFVTTAHWVFTTKYGLKYITDWGQKTIAVSEDIKKYLIDNYHLDEKNITVTINGIDTEKFSPENNGEKVKREFGLDGKYTLVYVSRMDTDRSLVAHQLIESVENLDKEFSGITAVIVGGGNDFDAVSEKAVSLNKKLGRDAIVMTGSRTDIADIAAAADLFVGVSRAALEAMSAAKPTVIAGNEGFIGLMSEEHFEEAYHTNFCCRFCRPSTPEELTEEIRRYFNMTENDRKRLASYSRQIILDNYSVGRMCDDAESVYRQVK